MEQPPVESPLAQQAHAPFRGMVFQSWLTVDAWLSLVGDERLFVERAEDFAVFGQSGALATQAKAISQPISLRSKGVLEAIQHLYEFQQRQPRLSLRLAFVTTAEITREQGEPFPGIAGLELWRRTALSREVAGAEQLRAFLVSDASVVAQLPAAVMAGLHSMTAAEFLERVVLRLSWDTGHDDETGVREAVEQRLQDLAVNRFGLNPGQACGLPAVLFNAVMEIAASGGQVALTQALLLKKAEAYFAPQFAAMAASRQSAMLGAVLSGAAEVAEWRPDGAAVPIQPTEDISRRTQAVGTIAKLLTSQPVVLLVGSTGMGKTTLAQLVSATIGGPWLQLQLGQDQGNPLSGLRECVALLGARATGGPSLIIDDLPWDDLGSAGENIMRALSYVARRGGARVILTNQKEPTARQLAATGLADALIERVPALAEEEIKEVAARLGCTDENVQNSWAKLLELQTQGHPQLVHASLLDLRARGWPAPTGAEFRTAATVIREERDRNQALLTKLGPDECELLIRLSVFIGTFRRDQALAMAQQLEPLGRSAPAFELLRGPWIEPVRKDYYRLSPLLGDAGAAGATADRIKEINRAAVAAIHACRPIYANDAANSLINAIFGEDHESARGIITRFLSAEARHARRVHDLLRWSLVWLGKRAFPNDTWTEALFRVLQFVVAAETIPDKATQYFDRVETLMGELSAEQARTLRCLLGLELFQLKQNTLPLAKVFALIPWVRDATNEHQPTDGKMMPGLGAGIRATTPVEQIEAGYALTILNSSQGLSFLEELWQTLDMATPEMRLDILKLLGRCPSLLILAFDRGWLEEEKKPVRAWERALVIYGRFAASASEWGNELIGVAAARALSIIHNEYCNDEAAALAALDVVQPADPEFAGVIAETRAKIALVNRRYSDAAALYAKALELPALPGLSHLPQELVLHNAGTAAGHAGLWSASANHFRAAYELAMAEEDWVRAGAFATDMGYALWRDGQKSAAIDRLAEALTLSARMPDPTTDLASLKVQKVLGNTLLRLAWGEGGRMNGHLTSPVLPGMCSDPGTTEAMRTLPPPMPDLAWTFVLWLEFEATSGSRYWNEHFGRLIQLPFPGTRYVAWELQARKFIRDGRIVEMLPLAVTLAAEIASAARRPKDASLYDWRESPKDRPVAKFGLNDSFPIPFFLLCGLTVAIIRGLDTLEVIGRWREVARETAIAADLATLLDLVEATLRLNVQAAWQLVVASDTIWQRWAASLRLLGEPKLDPDTLAGATLILTLPAWQKMKFDILPDLYRELDPHLSARWQAACENRFAFRSPTLFVPEIKALAAQPDGTVKHLAKLLLAALPALQLNVPAAMVQEVRNILTDL